MVNGILRAMGIAEQNSHQHLASQHKILRLNQIHPCKKASFLSLPAALESSSTAIPSTAWMRISTATQICRTRAPLLRVYKGKKARNTVHGRLLAWLADIYSVAAAK